MPHRPAAQRPRTTVLVVDNYDSFVYNLVQYLGELECLPLVHRHDAVGLSEIDQIAPDAILISPGPGRPDDAGISNELIREWAGRVPILGVCLGHQCVGQVFGGEVVRAPALFHGKTSAVHHRGVGVLAGLPDPFAATRYHSLVVDRTTVPDELEVTAWTDDDLVMGLRHRTHDIEGVQFHPESILTSYGRRILATWLARAGHESPEAVAAKVAGG